MTLVVAFKIVPIAILVSDLLVTSAAAQAAIGSKNERKKEKRRKAVRALKQTLSLPVAGEVSAFFAEQGFSIATLRQKLVLITPTCMVGCAGSPVGARAAVAALRKLAASFPLTRESMTEALKTCVVLSQNPASIVGWFNDGDWVREFAFGPHAVVKGAALDRVAAIGSGLDVVNAFANMFMEEGPTQGLVNESHIAIFRGAALASLLLRSELLHGMQSPMLLFRFGGGYEVGFRDGTREFKKLPELVFVFWEAAIDGNAGSLGAPIFLMKQTYVGEWLLLRSMRVVSGNLSEALTLKQDQLTAVPPLFDAPRPSIGPDFWTDMDSRLYCHCLAIRIGNRTELKFVLKGYDETTPSEIRVDFQNDQITLSVHESLVESLKNGLERFAKPVDTSSR